MPSFTSDVMTAFGEMTSLESPNDFFVASVAQGSEQLELFAKGKGGVAKVREILVESFATELAVAMFRITAVDDRGNVKSCRTKLVHVIYIGPEAPFMKRAKVSAWNSALKQPFSLNLSIQTDDVTDLSEASLERSLRASGGAHQPTSFDFTNSETGSGALERSMTLPSPKASPPLPESPSNVPRSPSGTRAYTVTWNEHNRAFHERNLHNLKNQYSEELCKLVFTDAATGAISISEGVQAIGETFEKIFDQYRDEYEVVKVDKTQPDSGHTSEGIVFCYWTSEQGAVSGFDTLCIVGGKVVVHTLVINRVAHVHDDQIDGTSQATAEFEDTAASNRADAGDLPSQEAASEPQESVSQAMSEDDYVEIDDQPPISVGDQYEAVEPAAAEAVEPAAAEADVQDSSNDEQIGQVEAPSEATDTGDASANQEEQGASEDAADAQAENGEEQQSSPEQE